MTEAYETRTKLSPADAERMARLTEEVQGRLEEMAHIAARTLGVRLSKDAVRKFVPREPVAQKTFEPHGPTVVEVEILDNFLGPGTRPCCNVALSNGDWFVECPCGSHG